MHTEKQNIENDSPIRGLIEDIPDTEMFKKGYLFAFDILQEDCFDVWNNRERWIGVSNLDGSKNHKKTNTVADKRRRNLPA